MTTAIKSVSVSLELVNFAEKYKISLSEAVRVGLSLMLSEIGEPQFLNKLNIGRKISSMAKIIQDQSTKLEEYQSVLEQK